MSGLRYHYFKIPQTGCPTLCSISKTICSCFLRNCARTQGWHARTQGRCGRTQGRCASKKSRPSEQTGIELTARFFPLNLLLYLCYPKIDIDGEVQKAAWRKTNFFPLLPGNYTVRVCVPYPDKPKYAMVEKLITVDEKNPCCLDYSILSWTSQPGRLTVNGVRAVSTAVKAQKKDSEESAFAGCSSFFHPV